MKVINSRDGIRRATVQVEHRVSFDDLVAVVCKYAVDEIMSDDERPERLSQQFIIGRLKDYYKFQGSESVVYWADEISEDEQDEITEWARGVVRRAFGVRFGLGVG